jgi:hypothetical protein
VLGCVYGYFRLNSGCLFPEFDPCIPLQCFWIFHILLNKWKLLVQNGCYYLHAMRFQGSEGLESLVQFWVSGHFVSLIDNAIIEVESNNLEISSGNEPEQRQGHSESRPAAYRQTKLEKQNYVRTDRAPQTGAAEELPPLKTRKKNKERGKTHSFFFQRKNKAMT